VRDKVNLAQRGLPDEIEAPIIRKQDPDSSPVLGFAISGTASEREITEYADKIFRPQIESADGVGEVIIAGARLRQINIIPDPYKMRAYGLSVNDITTALQRDNVARKHRAVEIVLWSVPSSLNGTANLDQVATFKRGLGPTAIKRLNRQRQIVVSANTAPGASAGAIVNGMQDAFQKLDLPAGYVGEPSGSSREQEKATQAFLLAIGLSVVFHVSDSGGAVRELDLSDHDFAIVAINRPVRAVFDFDLRPIAQHLFGVRHLALVRRGKKERDFAG